MNLKNKKVVILTFVTLGFFTIFILLKNNSSAPLDQVTQPVQQNQPNTSQINYNPPTTEEKNTGNIQKNKITDQSTKVTTPTNNSAEVIIVDASQYSNTIEVRAFVANHIESGTCTYTFTKDTQKIEKSKPANSDATTSPCITLDVPKSEFTVPGTWNLTVSYTSESNIFKGSAFTTLEVTL